MFNFFTKTKAPAEPTFELRQMDNKFAIVKNGETPVAVYTRKADAVRGATRKGITLANA